VLAFVLVVASAFLHAAWNALVRRSPDPQTAVHVVVAIAGVLAAIVAAVELSLGYNGLPPRAIGLGVVAGVLEAGYFHALGRALAIAPLPPVYTVSRGGAALLVWPASILAFGERVTALAAAGSALVILGLAVSSELGRGARGAPARALIWAAQCAGFIAGYHVAYKYALAADASPGAVFAISMVVATGLGATLGGAGYRTRFVALVRARPLLTVGAGVVCATAFLLFMIGLAGGGAAYVFTLRNTSVLFAVVLAWTIGDHPSRAQVIGATLVFAGAILLGLGH
jgi:drug/metabolite transporter (DMT)-like permease